ncbi:MAG: hypothetical protein NXH70_02105 [Hyphomonas sp.]|nr:hypothetical protein [Hyphomonas sp.]
MKKPKSDELITSHFGAVYLGKQQRRQKRDRKLRDKAKRRRR